MHKTCMLLLLRWVVQLVPLGMIVTACSGTGGSNGGVDSSAPDEGGTAGHGGFTATPGGS
jgi:hypothetical protein